VDVGAGFGEAIQVWNTVREMERIGIAGMQIEDQVYPKRAHYHRDYQERTIELEHMLEKITAAKEARRDPDFVICGRTDTMKTEGFKEAVRRGNAFAEAGADIIYVFPNNLEETKNAPKAINAPVVYGVSHGNRVGRPVLTPAELASYGYRVISYPTLLILEVFGTLKRVLTDLKTNDGKSVDQQEMIKLRKEIEDTIGLEHLYAIEERTTEKDRKRA
jgi:methylisocitrate lyase